PLTASPPFTPPQPPKLLCPLPTTPPCSLPPYRTAWSRLAGTRSRAGGSRRAGAGGAQLGPGPGTRPEGVAGLAAPPLPPAYLRACCMFQASRKHLIRGKQVRGRGRRRGGRNGQLPELLLNKARIEPVVPEQPVLKGLLNSTTGSCEPAPAHHCIEAFIMEMQAKTLPVITKHSKYFCDSQISAPNEFDVMFTMPAPRVKLEQCDDSGAFYYVRLKRNPQGNELDKFLQEDGTLAACKMLFALRNIIKEIVKKMKVTVDKKKAGSPAITLRIGNPPMEISVDIILALEVRSQSWPASTQEGLKIEEWLGSKVKQEYKWKPIYLVPKHAKDGRALKEDTWRLSFSHIEKDMIKNHGKTKTCCESKGVKCCRKSCLKLLKHLLDQLKTKDGNRRGLDKFCSYHAKTAFFQACVLWPDDKQWLLTDLESCFQKFLNFFLNCLNNAKLPHFFIPTHNLFSRQLIDKASSDFLSKEIKYEINNRFPIFELQN
uniref:Uncharacterized protein n=1 Tax=Gopherus agassizii TaxID=38772 RepID=A0A452J4V1_9SAUR